MRSTRYGERREQCEERSQVRGRRVLHTDRSPSAPGDGAVASCGWCFAQKHVLLRWATRREDRGEGNTRSREQSTLGATSSADDCANCFLTGAHLPTSPPYDEPRLLITSADKSAPPGSRLQRHQFAGFAFSAQSLSSSCVMMARPRQIEVQASTAAAAVEAAAACSWQNTPRVVRAHRVRQSKTAAAAGRAKH